MQNPDIPVMRIGDLDYYGWTSMSIVKSLDKVCGSFSATIPTLKLKSNESIFSKCADVGMRVLILFGSEVVMNGYIDSINFESNSSGTMFNVKGRDRTSDLIDCSIEKSPGEWKGFTLRAFANLICQDFNIFADNVGDFEDTHSDFVSQIGETPFELIVEGAKQRGVLLLTDEYGDLVISTPGATSTHDSLVYGENGNIKSIRGKWDFSNRFYKYIIKSQTSSEGFGWSDGATDVFGQAYDNSVRTKRVFIRKSKKGCDSLQARKEAGWEANTRAAKSEEIIVTVLGTRQSNGDLWDVNQLVPTNIVFDGINIKDSMLISSIERKHSKEGLLTYLTLIRKDAYNTLPKRKLKKKDVFGWE